MTGISRRDLLTGAAAAVVAGGAALGAAPKALTQGPGVYRHKLGDTQLTALYDGLWSLKIDDKFVRNADGAAVNAALAAAFLPPNILPVSFTVLLVNTGSKLVLIDAGTAGQIADTAGFLMANLAAAGIAPAAIDTIVISHFHPDHIDGLKTKDGDKVFANAEILVPEPEWTYWMDDAEMNKAPDRIKVYFRNARRIFGDIAKDVRRFKPGAEVAPGITSIPAFGHTPGHTAFAIASGTAIDAGDERRGAQPVSVRAPSGMAAAVRHGWAAGGEDAKADARPRRRRPHAGRGLSLPVPGLRPYRAKRQGLRARADGVAAALELARPAKRQEASLAAGLPWPNGRTNDQFVAAFGALRVTCTACVRFTDACRT